MNTHRTFIPRRSNRLGHLLVTGLMGWGLLAMSCTDDTAEPDGTLKISVAASPNQSDVNGAVISVSVTVFRSDNSPMPSGTTIDILEFGCVDTNTPKVGRFADNLPGDCASTQKTITGSNGSVTAQFQCVAEGATRLLAAPTGVTDTAGIAEISCVPGPNGQWTIASITRTDGTLETGGKTVKLTAQAFIEDGATAPPAGIRLEAEVVEGNSLKLQGPGLVPTDAAGKAEFVFVTNNNEGESVVEVRFQDERFGMPSTESFRVRAPNGNNGTTLEVRVRRNNQVVNGEERTILADGEDTLQIEAELVPAAGAEFSLEGQPVSFKLISGPGFFNSPDTEEISVNTDNSGRAAVTFVGGDSPGTAVIEVGATDPDPDAVDPELGETVNINVTALGFVEYVGVNPNVLYVRGSGQNETGTVTFRVLNTNREPIEGVRVEMRLPDLALGGASLNPSITTSDERGLVSTTIQSGTSTGAINVTAVASMGAITLPAPSASIPIVGARPTRNAFGLQCEFRNIGGFIGRQGDRVVVRDQFACSSTLLDRFQNPIGVAQQITYLSEGGNIISPQTSTAWNTTTNPNSPPDNVGKVAAPYSPEGDPPCDVDPLEERGEPFIFFDADECPPTLNNCPERLLDDCSRNPRDGLVTIIAITTGEEAFNDINNNGAYDEGEPFWDLGEPFLDTNDNNEYDEGEPFRDLTSEAFPQGNRTYDGPNGVWDNNTTIWTSTNVLLSGTPAYLRTTNDFDGFPARTAGHSFDVRFPDVKYAPGQTIEVNELNSTLAVQWLDANLSVLNNSTVYGVSLVGDNTGLRLTAIDGPDADFDYGFDVAFTTAELDDVRNTYITRLRNFIAAGHIFRAQLTVQNPANFNPNPVVRFTAAVNIAPGVGGAVVHAIDVPVSIVLEDQ